MSYYVYKVFETPFRRLEKLDMHESYSAASKQAKMLRSELDAEAAYVIKVIFADSELHAEDLLNELRSPLANPEDV